MSHQPIMVQIHGDNGQLLQVMLQSQQAVEQGVSRMEAVVGRLEGAWQQSGKGAMHAATELQRLSTVAGAGGDALQGLGHGAALAEEKVEGSARSIINAVQRTIAAMEAGDRQSAQFYRALGEARGVDMRVLDPHLRQLEELSGRQRRAAVTSGELDAAMRNLPAQFTDIVTSLSAGQDPLLVFLQQGGQIKDMFGGVGPAARAMGGYILGLVNPFTVAAAAAGVLLIAHEVGAKEGRAYSAALLETNHAAGISADAMAGMAAAIDGYYGTQHAAAEAVAALAATGEVAGANMERFAATSLRWSDATGQSVADVAQRFAELGKDPVAAALKLDESQRFLTATTLDQIQTLEEQGQHTEAARLAQEALADAMDKRTPQMLDNTGWLEKGWKAVASAVKEAGDALLDIGRKQTLAEQIADKRQALARLRTTSHHYDQPSWVVPKVEQELAALEAQAQREAVAARQAAEREATRKRGVAATRDLNQLLETGATKAQKMGKALGDMHRKVADAAAAGKAYTAQEIASMEAGIRARYKESAPRRPSRAAQYGSAEDHDLSQLRAQIADEKLLTAAIAQHGAEADKLTSGQKLQNKLAQEATIAKTDAARAHVATQQALAKELATLQLFNRAQQEMAKSARELQDAMLASEKQQWLDADALRQRYETPLQREQREHTANVAGIQGNGRLSAAEQARLLAEETARNQRAVEQPQYGVREQLGAVPDSEKVIRAHQDMQRRIAEVTAEGSDARVQLELAANRKLQQDTEALERQKTSTMLAMSGQVFDGLAQMAEQAGGRQSAAYKAMFLASRAASIAMAVVNTEEAATKALTMGPILGVPAATMVRGLGYASVGIMAAQAIQGMAHDGIDHIPREGTWLLDRGERVVDSRTNADLKQYLQQRQGGARGEVKVVIINNVGAQVTQQERVGADGSKEIVVLMEKVAETVYSRRQAADMRPGGVLYGG